MSRNFSATRISFQYVQRGTRASYLALYGLLATVQECLCRVGDSQVSNAKLGWWIQELQAARVGRGTHPLSVQLGSCGALHSWPQALLSRYFTLALQRIDAPGLNNETELQDWCEAMGMVHLELECALNNQTLPKAASLRRAAAVNGYLQLLRESFWAPHADFYWVPLTACAQLNMHRNEIVERIGSRASLKWIREVSRLVLDLGSDEATRDADIDGLPVEWVRNNQHWLIFSMLQQRQVRRVERFSNQQRRAAEIAQQLSQLNFTDGWAAWRLAMRLQ